MKQKISELSEFDALYISEETAKSAKQEFGLSKLSNFQKTSFPLILGGIDSCIEVPVSRDTADTFALPVIERIDPEDDNVQVLILALTREHVRKTASFLNRVGQDIGIRAAAIYPKISQEKQFKALERANVVCATPNQLNDLYDEKQFTFDGLKLLCFEQADELFADNETYRNLGKVLRPAAKPYDTVIAAHRITNRVQHFADRELTHCEFYHQTQPDSSKASDHRYYLAEQMTSTKQLVAVLDAEAPTRGILVVSEEHDLDATEQLLEQQEYRTDVIRASFDKPQLEGVIQNLQAQRIDLLLLEAGADLGGFVRQISHLFFFGLPADLEDYITLIRQAQPTESTVSLFRAPALGDFHKIKRKYRISFERSYLPTKAELRKRKEQERFDQFISYLVDGSPIPYGGKIALAEQFLERTEGRQRLRAIAKMMELSDTVFDGRYLRDFDDDTGRNYEPALENVHTDEVEEMLGLKEPPEPEETAEYSMDESEPEMKQEDEKPDSAHKQETESQQQTEPTQTSISVEKMYINVGEDRFDNADDLIEHLCQKSGFTEEEFENVSMLNDYSFVEVRESFFRDIVGVLNRQEWGNKQIKAERARS